MWGINLRFALNSTPGWVRSFVSNGKNKAYSRKTQGYLAHKKQTLPRNLQ